MTRSERIPASADESPALRCSEVSLAYHDGDATNYAVADVTLGLPPTGFVGIMGPSGSGKSSLLYLLSGLKRPSHGDVSFGALSFGAQTDAALARLRRERFGFVFQQPYLLNYLTAMENVLVAAAPGDRDAAERAAELFDRLGIADLAGRFPFHLSGGERQRVCVARAMMNAPAVIFADEPTASLDHANGHMVIDLLAGYRERGLVIVVTHDAEMLADADSIVRLRDGRLEAEGATTDVPPDAAV